MIAAAMLAGCAGKQMKNMAVFKAHVSKVQEDNKKACISGCTVFEGDSNVEWLKLQDYFKEPACNFGWRGSTTADVLKRKDKVFQLKPKTIVLLVGGNDLILLTDPAKIKENYEELIGYYKTFCMNVYCISNLPVNLKIFIKNTDILNLNERLKQACLKKGAKYINVFPYLAKEGGLNPDYAIDPVHLNKAGQDVLMGIIKQYLRK
jgi:lysophospholipase L1-like esterase